MKHARAIALACLLAGSACSVSHSRGLGTGAQTVSGVVAAQSSLSIDGDVGDVTLRLGGPRDSVRWSLSTDPPGCAAPDVSSARIAIKERARTCSIRWNVSAPPIEDVVVDVSVGDIEINARADRALRLRSGVGSVKLLLDNRELRHAGAPGSGDELELGDANSRPRLSARTGVGKVSVALSTALIRSP